MPNLNMPEGMRSPVRPMMAGGGGGMRTTIIILLVVVVLGGGGYFLYTSGMLPFGKKSPPPPVEVVPPAPEITLPQPEVAPPPEVKPPEPTPPPMGTGNFTVVIYSYFSRKLAEDEAARWTNAGFPAMVTEKNVGGTTVYRVSIGRYETRKLASNAGKEIEHMLETGYWVDRLQ